MHITQQQYLIFVKDTYMLHKNSWHFMTILFWCDKTKLNTLISGFMEYQSTEICKHVLVGSIKIVRNTGNGYYSYRTPQTHLLSNKSCGFPLLLKSSSFQAAFSVTAFLYQEVQFLASFLCRQPLLFFFLLKQCKATCNFIQWDLLSNWTLHCYNVCKIKSKVIPLQARCGPEGG